MRSVIVLAEVRSTQPLEAIVAHTEAHCAYLRELPVRGRLVDRAYVDLPFPFSEVTTPAQELRLAWGLEFSLVTSRPGPRCAARVRRGAKTSSSRSRVT
jgi:hypothetical protein